jgi:hypothetical protein
MYYIYMTTYTYTERAPSWEPSFWERGTARYAILSYSLWMRHIYWDLRGRKPGKKFK